MKTNKKPAKKMNTSDAYDPNDRFDLTPAGAEYLAGLDAYDPNDDGRDEAFTGAEYVNDLAPLDAGNP